MKVETCNRTCQKSNSKDSPSKEDTMCYDVAGIDVVFAKEPALQLGKDFSQEDSMRIGVLGLLRSNATPTICQGAVTSAQNRPACPQCRGLFYRLLLFLTHKPAAAVYSSEDQVKTNKGLQHLSLKTHSSNPNTSKCEIFFPVFLKGLK